MGQLRKIIPESVKKQMLEAYNERFPSGSIRRHTADAITIAGGVSVAAGAVLDKVGYPRTGAGMRALGQVADDIDGDVSRALKTDGRQGSVIDSVTDKAKVLLELGVLFAHTKVDDTIPRRRTAQLAFIAAKHTVNAGLNMQIERNGREARSNWAGKANMWADGVSLSAWGIADAAHSPGVKAAGEALATAGFMAGIVLGTVAAIDYARQAIDSSKYPSAPEQPIQLT